MVAVTGGAAHAASVDSAEYDVSASVLTVTLDEPAFPIDAAHVTLTGGQGGTVVVSQGSVSHANNTATVSIDLSGQSGDFEALSHPRSVVVAANGILAISGNTNSDAVTLAISYDDVTPPAISSASYATSSGVLIVTLTEAVQSVSAGDVTLTDGSATTPITGAALSHDSGTITISLDDSTRQAFEAMSHPRSIQFAAGSLADTWGNSNGAASSHAISYDDATPPAISSASYATSSGVLIVTLTEAVRSVSAGDVTLADGSATISITGAALSHDSDTITISLDDSTRQAFEAMSHPRSVQFAAGGLTDRWGNSNAAASSHAISYDDATPPAISSASYVISSGVLTVTLTEAVRSVSAGDVTLTDGSATASITGAALSHDSDTITISLDDSTRQAFEAMSHPRSMQFAAGSLADTWGNSNAASTSAISYDDATPPAISSASYDMATAMLTVALTEGALPIANIMLVGDQGSIVVQDIAHARGADSFDVTLGGDTRTDFEALSGDTVRLRAGSVYDVWGNFNAEELAASITRVGEMPEPVPMEPAPPEEPEDIVLGPMTAEYDLETRILSVTTPAVVSSIDMDLIVLHDARDYMQVGNPVSVGNVPFFVIPFSAAIEAEFLELEQPRQVTVMPGGFTYLANNATNQANVTATITYGDDTTPPDMAAAQYDVSSGDLTLRFNERVLPASTDHIRLDNITIGADDVSHAPNSLTISLSGQAGDRFVAMDPPRSVTVTSGGITDVAGNSNTDDITATITYLGDDSPPGVLAVAYDNSTNSLVVTLSEPALAILPNVITLEYNITSAQPGSIAHDARAASFGVPLGNATGAGLPHSVTVAAGGLTDVWGNSNEAALTVDVRRDAPPPADPPAEPPADAPIEPPVTPATISSAIYDVTSGTLAVALTEDILTLLEYKIHLGAMGEVPAGSLSYVQYNDSFAVSLSSAQRDIFASLPLPRQVAIISGGLVDSSGRINIANITSAISYVGDDAPPTVLSALYDNSTNSVILKLSEPVLTPAAGQIRISYANATASPTPVHAAPSDSMALPLDTLPGAPPPLSVTFDAASLIDVWGNANAAAITWNITDAAPPVEPLATPAAVSSAVYNVTSSTLTVTLTENVLALVADKVRLDDTGDGVADASLSYANGSAAFAVTLAGSEKDRFASLAPPRYVTIAPGGLVDSAGRVNVADIAGAVTYVGDNVPPGISSITYDNSTRSLNVTLSEPALTPSAGIYLVYDSGPVPAVTVMHTSHTDSLAILLAANATPPASVRMDTGSLSDIWGNANPMPLMRNVMYAPPPPAPAAISAATYNVTSAVLGVTLTENVLTVLPGNVHLDASGGGVPADSLSHTNGTDSFAIALSGAERDRFESLPVPRAITISPGGLVDVHGRANAANLTGTISYTDAESPGISSASYNATAGVILVGLTEPAISPALDRVRLSGPAGEVAAASIVHGTDAFRITLNDTAAFEGLGTPAHVIITPGGLADLWGNANAANLTGAISYPDTQPPTIRSATYDAASNVLTVSFDEAISSPVIGKVQVTGPGGQVGLGVLTHLNDSFAVSLTGLSVDRFGSTQPPTRVTIQPGGVSDLSGNANDGTMTRIIDVAGGGGVAGAAVGAAVQATVSTGVTSVVYNTTSAEITITANATLALVDASKITLHDRSSRLTLSGSHQVTPAVTAFTLPPLSAANQTTFESMTLPRSMTILPDGLNAKTPRGSNAFLTHAISYTDTAPPAIRSATYDTATGTLTVSLNEPALAPSLDKIRLNGTASEMTLSAPPSHSNDTFTITLNSTERASFEGLGYPRSVTITGNGISDIWGAQNAANLTHAVSYAGNTPPTVSSAAYDTITGVLNITMSEPVASHDSSRIVLHDSAMLNNVTFSAGDFDQHVQGYLNATLNATQMASLEGLSLPRSVAILPGGVTDTWNNANTAHLSVRLSYTGDAAPPAMQSAAYDTMTGALNLTMSEPLGGFDSAKIVLYDSTKSGNVTFAANDFAQSKHGHLSATLNATQKTALEGLNHPRSVAVLAGGVTDVWGNANAANLAGTLSHTDNTPPAMQSAVYDATSKVLNVTFSEPVLPSVKMDAASYAVFVPLPSATNTAPAASVAITLSGSDLQDFEYLRLPRSITVPVNGTTDVWGNANAAELRLAVTYAGTGDNTPPGLSSATYDAATGVLTLALSERLGDYNVTRIVVHDSVRSGNVTFSSANFAQTTAGNLTAILNDAQETALESLSHPRSVAILPGGVTDIWGNANAALLNGTISYTDATPPAMQSAVYDATSKVLSVTFSEPVLPSIAMSAASRGASVPLTSTHTAPTASVAITLAGSDLQDFENLRLPRSVAVPANGAADNWGNTNPAELKMAITYTGISDSTPPAVQSVAYDTTTGALNLTMSEQLGDYNSTKIVLYDSTKSGNVTFSANHLVQSKHGYLNATLNAAQRTSFEALSHPRSVAVLAGGVTDIWGNANTADLNGTMSYTDATPPAMQSAVYDAASKVLNVTFSEPVLPSVKIEAASYGVWVQLTSTHTAPTASVTITLAGADLQDFENLRLPRSAVVIVNGTADIWGNGNTKELRLAITYASTGDNTPPDISSAAYDIATGALNLTMSERLGDYDPAKIALYDSTKSGNVTFSANNFAQSKHGYLDATLNATQRTSFESLGHPRSAAILAGGVTDIWGNANTAHLSAAISYSGDSTPPAVRSATYDVTTGVLNLTMSEPLGDYDSVNIVLHDSAKLNNVTFSAGDFDQHAPGYLNATLTNAQRAAFEAFEPPPKRGHTAGRRNRHLEQHKRGPPVRCNIVRQRGAARRAICRVQHHVGRIDRVDERRRFVA